MADRRGAGDLHRQLAAGRDPSGQHARDRRSALLAWHERLDQGSGAARHVAKRVRTAGDDHDDDRRTAVEQRVEEVSLYARQPEILDIATLAGGSAPEQTGPVTDKCDAQLRVAGRVDRGREPGAVCAGNRAAGLVHDLDVGQFRLHGVDRARDVDAEIVLNEGRQLVIRERVTP